jgi:hypothetical protein
MKTKICSRCEIKKNLSEFTIDRQKKDGHRPDCKVCVKIIQKHYQQTHKEQINKTINKWKKKNIIKVRLSDKKSHKRRYHSNLLFKLENNLKNRMLYATGKSFSKIETIQILGCNFQELQQYIESKFKSGMTWKNYGCGFNGKGMSEWVIDHIKPCIKFNLNNYKELKDCFHHSNIQPLWADENRHKYIS